MVRSSQPTEFVMSKTADNDVFGRQLYANYNGFPSETLERDDGRIDTWPAAYYFSTPSSWRPAIVSALDRVDGTTIDIGCGAGRHALYLQSRGIPVTAIDKSPGAVAVARLCGVDDAQCVDVEAMGDTFVSHSVDTFVMLGSNLGLLQSKGQALDILDTMHKLARKRARIIGEGMNPYVSKDPDHIAYCSDNIKKNRAYGSRMLRSVFQQETGDWFQYLALSPHELADLSLQSGWRVDAVKQEPTGRYIAVLEKS